MIIKVNISDAKISSNPEDSLITYALGSCIGLTLYDPKAGVGGMLHCLLPDCNEAPEKARDNPFKFADSGFELLLGQLLELGAEKRRLQAVIAGGAHRIECSSDLFNIGKLNYLAIRKALWRAGLIIKGEDVGGANSRTMSLNLADGSVTLLTGKQQKVFHCSAPHLCLGDLNHHNKSPNPV